MQKKQQRSMKRNTEETWKTSEDKKRKKAYFGEGNYQEGSQQENCLNGQTRGMMKNTGQGQKETGEDGKEEEQGNNGQWKL